MPSAPQPRLIIVCGLPGAGKTTHAKAIERELRAIRFAPDEWMDVLGVNLWDSETRQRIEQLQWKLAQDYLMLGHHVVIEWGTWGRSERDTLRIQARALGVGVELHYLDAPIEILFERIQARNRETPAVSLDDLVQWRALIEPPTPEELALFDPGDGTPAR